MNADAGDWLVIKSGTIGRPDLRGLITSVRSPNGEPPYRVRWLATGEEATVFPGPDAIVVTAAEQKAADERARSRFAGVQAAIRDHARSGQEAK
ncbi:hypothetical protein A5756_05260 [Mycobacterium sp. 852002-53434_SCH5985345]|uniref:DUF1918 domain-containing protein n=1 Tax=Mycobacterium sp. 852002-53434_SCH5985345 TaxID=1834107 RepID=UPI0007FE7A91|nr:DUF1918 domain-containing protein [Mycobacterium sp. 852002-53434_SCH5985345]OBF59652.1 hypothetical protein A5756_05260 [Mycobacterium sp. 852002-53434_SCH5985345]